MANINTKVINIARLSPISKIIPTNTRNNVNGKAVADYVGEGGGGDSKQIEAIINERFAKIKQFIDDNYLKGKVVYQDELPPIDERIEDLNYFVIPNEEKSKEDFDGMVLNLSIPSNDFELDLFDYVGGNSVDDAVIDWGDGSETVIINSSTSTLSHTYSSAGDYQLKIKGSIKWKSKQQSSADSSLSKCVTSIELPTNNSPIVDIGNCGFMYFNKLTTIPAGLFDKCTSVTDFSNCFSNCSSLQSIPERLFANCPEVTTFRYCFLKCTSLQTIPGNLFDNALATKFYYCFSNCSSLQAIPEGLFDKCTAATDFSYCFYSCSSLQSIPEGLFDKCTAVTTFGHCFEICKALQSIPEGLFDNNTLVIGFIGCFRYCTSLQSIPEGLFDNNTKVTTFTDCFYNCNELQSIPEGLFDNNTLATSFANCFWGCDALQSIPEGLFDKCPLVTSFITCFYNCKAVINNLPMLWISHPRASHTRCFYNCTNATNYQAAVNAGWVN